MSEVPLEKDILVSHNKLKEEKEIITLDKLNKKIEEKRKSKEEEVKEGLNAENIGAFKEDVLVGDRSNMRIKKRKEYSKYDFIKVRVTLGEHFYVLSRFLVSRMLTLCKVFKIFLR